MENKAIMENKTTRKKVIRNINELSNGEIVRKIEKLIEKLPDERKALIVNTLNALYKVKTLEVN